VANGQELEITAAKTSKYSITLSTQGYDTNGYLDQMETDLKRRGADVGADALTTSVEGYMPCFTAD
jgi:hypothetical protein